MTEVQGQPAPEATETTTETPTVTVEVEEKPKGKAGFSQQDLNKAAGNAREEGRQVAVTDLLKELGLDSPDTLKSIVQERKDAEEAQRSEADKLQKQLDKAQNRVTELETSNSETLTKAQQVALNSEARLSALSLDVKPERVNAVLKLANLSEVTVSEDFEADATAIEKAIKDVLEEYPEFANRPPNNIGDGGSNPPGEPPNPNPSVSQMPDEQFADMWERAKRGERVTLR